MKSTILGVVAALGLSFGLSGAAQADLLADIKAKGKIVAATEMHYAPFDILKDGKYQGICHDLFTEVAKELGVEVEFLDLPWQSILPGLEAGKFDIVNAPVTITAERMSRYSFTLPIGNATVALAKKAGDDSITKPEDIAGKAVGSQKGDPPGTGLTMTATGVKWQIVKNQRFQKRPSNCWPRRSTKSQSARRQWTS